MKTSINTVVCPPVSFVAPVTIPFDCVRPPTSTPWGAIHHSRMIQPGVWSFSTAGHGGMYVAPSLREHMPEQFRAFAPWAGEGWYEEDCDWAIVCLSFPNAFDGRSLHNALEMLTPRGYFAALDVDGYLASDKGKVAKAKALEWFTANSTLFEFVFQAGGAGGCSGELISVDRTQRFSYRCERWPMIDEPTFTLEQARAAGLQVMPVK